MFDWLMFFSFILYCFSLWNVFWFASTFAIFLPYPVVHPNHHQKNSLNRRAHHQKNRCTPLSLCPAVIYTYKFVISLLCFSFPPLFESPLLRQPLLIWTFFSCSLTMAKLAEQADHYDCNCSAFLLLFFCSLIVWRLR